MIMEVTLLLEREEILRGVGLQGRISVALRYQYRLSEKTSRPSTFHCDLGVSFTQDLSKKDQEMREPDLLVPAPHRSPTNRSIDHLSYT